MTAESDLKKIKSLQKENYQLRNVLESMKNSPLIVGHVQNVLKDGRVIVSHVPGNQLLIPSRPDLTPEPGDTVSLHGTSFVIIENLSHHSGSLSNKFLNKIRSY